MSDYGYDIGPDERMIVDVLTDLSNDPGSEGEPIYEQFYISRSANHPISEPLDLSESPHDSSSSTVPMINNTQTTTRSEHQKFHSERERLKTFEGVWKPEYNVTKEDLARDGFIYKGPGDRVLCVFCLKSIRKWDKNDKVAGEHKRLYPRCPWVNGMLHHMNIPISQIKLRKSDMGLSSRGLPQYTDMAKEPDRFATFSQWPSGRITGPSALAHAGYFYDDTQDILNCFHCGLRVTGFDDLSKLNENHMESSPECPMVVGIANTVVTATSEEPIRDESMIEREGEETSNAEAEPNPIDIEEDMDSPAVQAVKESFDEFTLEDIRKAVQKIRLLKESGPINSKELMQTLDPRLKISDL